MGPGEKRKYILKNVGNWIVVDPIGFYIVWTKYNDSPQGQKRRYFKDVSN